MGRIGVSPEQAPDLAEEIGGMDNLRLEGTCTHFPVSDSPDKEDIQFTIKQISIFNDAINGCYLYDYLFYL